jgi:hypothetical protein
MRWWLVLLVGCGFHSHPASSDAAISDGPADAPIDSSIDGPPPPSSPRRLVIDNTTPATFSNFRLYVPLDATSVDYSIVTDPTTELRFHDEAANADLQFEVDHWNPAGESGVWVKVSSLPPGMLSSTLMYFGPSANGISKPAQVWGGYDLVQHMEPGFANSVGINYQGSGLGVTTAAGQLGNAVTFAGSGDEQVDFAAASQLFDGWSAFTLEFWIYPDYAAAGDVTSEPLFMGKGVSLNAGRMIDASGQPQVQVDLEFTGNNAITMPVPVTLRQWNYVVYTFDGQRVKTYVSGAQVDMQNVSGGSQTEPADTEDFFLGDPANPFKGQLDELRIEQGGARSADWFALQYAAMTRRIVTFTAP